MVEQDGRLAVMAQVHMLPVRDSFVGLKRTVIGVDTRRDIVLNPPLRAVFLAVGHEPHSRFDTMREEFGDARLGGELDSSWQRIGFRHLGEILLDWHVRTEMQEVFQLVSVDIPHAVEIAGSEPVGVEYLLRFRATDALQQEALELIVRQAVLRAGTDVIIVAPELLRHFGTAYVLQQASAVLNRCPLQHAANRHMEHDGVVVFENRRIEDTGLTQ